VLLITGIRMLIQLFV